MLSLFVSLKIDKIHHLLFVGMEMLKTKATIYDLFITKSIYLKLKQIFI